MRKLLFLLVVVLCVGCTSKEDKVNKLIKDDMFKSLYDFESYEPIETKIDSAFNSVFRDSLALALAQIISKQYIELRTDLENVKKEERIVDIWLDSYSSLGRRYLYEAKEKWLSSIEKAKETMSVINSTNLLIQEVNKTIGNEFIGWKVVHKFRCKTKGGNFDLGNKLYIFDKDIKNINYTEDLDDEGNQGLAKIIDDALKYDPENDK